MESQSEPCIKRSIENFEFTRNRGISEVSRPVPLNMVPLPLTEPDTGHHVERTR